MQISQYIDRVFARYSEAERADILNALVNSYFHTVALPCYDDWDGWKELQQNTGLSSWSVLQLQNSRPTKAGPTVCLSVCLVVSAIHTPIDLCFIILCLLFGVFYFVFR